MINYVDIYFRKCQQKLTERPGQVLATIVMSNVRKCRTDKSAKQKTVFLKGNDFFENLPRKAISGKATSGKANLIAIDGQK